MCVVQKELVAASTRQYKPKFLFVHVAPVLRADLQKDSKDALGRDQGVSEVNR